MKKLIAFLFLFIALVGSLASAAQTDFVCLFVPGDPPDPAVVFVVEQQKPDGSGMEVARGAGSATGSAVNPGELSISFSQNASFGNYIVRVRVILPITGPYSDWSAPIVLSPGKPSKVAVSSNRSGGAATVAPAKVQTPVPQRN